MNIRRYIVRLAALIGLAFLAGAPAAYALNTADAQFNVRTYVGGICYIHVDGGDLVFPNYTGAAIADGSHTTVDLQCTPNETVTLLVNHGSHHSGTQRYMVNTTNPGASLSYNLGKNQTCSQPWGDSGTEIENVPTTGGHQHFTIYGCMIGGQSGTMGLYTDLVTVTVEFP